MRSVGGDGFVWYCHLLPLTESTKVRGRGGVSYRNTHQKTQRPKGPCWKRAPEVTQLQCSHPKWLGVVWEAWASAPTCPGNTSDVYKHIPQATRTLPGFRAVQTQTLLLFAWCHRGNSPVRGKGLRGFLGRHWSLLGDLCPPLLAGLTRYLPSSTRRCYISLSLSEFPPFSLFTSVWDTLGHNYWVLYTHWSKYCI